MTLGISVQDGPDYTFEFTDHQSFVTARLKKPDQEITIYFSSLALLAIFGTQIQDGVEAIKAKRRGLAAPTVGQEEVNAVE